jgi:hypothetical protein
MISPANQPVDQRGEDLTCASEAEPGHVVGKVEPGDGLGGSEDHQSACKPPPTSSPWTTVRILPGALRRRRSDRAVHAFWRRSTGLGPADLRKKR